jgi:hypothetical protein
VSRPKNPPDRELAGLIKEQTEAFRRKFGRAPDPRDPLLFDPEADEPRSLIDDETQQHMIEEMTTLMEEAGAHPAHIYAFQKTGRIVTEENSVLLTAAEQKEWHSALREYERRSDRQSKAVELCFEIRARAGKKRTSREEHMASGELAIAAMYALQDGVSSFAMESAFVNAWLIEAAKRVGITADSAQEIRDRLGAGMKEMRVLLRALDEEFGPVEWNESMRRHLAKIEAAREEPENWLGMPPFSPRRAEKEMEGALECLRYALTNMREAGTAASVIEGMLLRAWLRMIVVNDRLPEEFFQRLDRRWPDVLERVDSWVVRAARPLVQ